MIRVLKADFYRLKKSELYLGALMSLGLIAVILTMLNRQDIRLGISVFGDLTMFKSVEDVVKIGINYQKGLGLFVAIVVTFFIGQEYQWNTWQHKWLINKNRETMYLSKMILSIISSISLFLTFELVTLLLSGKIVDLITVNYTYSIIGGIFVYAALGSLISMISMLIKNSTVAIIVSLCYIMFSETFFCIIQNLKLEVISGILNWLLQHTIYGMSITINTVPMTPAIILQIIATSFVIAAVSSIIGILAFRKYEI